MTEAVMEEAFQALRRCEVFLGLDDSDLERIASLPSCHVEIYEEGGTISILLCGDKNQIIVVVKDTGMGISKKDLPFIFERLYRGDKSRNQIEGSGIGLTISKKILIHHSAVIDVESEEGVGTDVTVRFTR